jgi:hypothetical protein
LRVCREFTGDVLIVESEHDTMVPHQVIVNYREACVNARSLTYRLMEGVDHGLSNEAWHRAYTALLVTWFNEFVFGKKKASEGTGTDSRAAIVEAEPTSGEGAPQPEA